jgi:hypothetical protein
MTYSIKINRAPVLTLWAVVVAERLGYNRSEALSLGKTVAGLNAQAKGKRLGIFHPREPEDKAKPRQGEALRVRICGREVPMIKTAEGVRATISGTSVSPESVQGYIQRSFGDKLESVQDAMRELAKSHSPRKLEVAAYSLYEQFRPKIPGGTRGWGVKGDLDLKLILSLARAARPAAE